MPVHLVSAEMMRGNIERMQSVLKKHAVAGELFFAKKANKSRLFAAVAANAGIGIDVASEGELLDTLAAGVKGEHISVSGPHKARSLLALAVSHSAVIAIDSVSELQDLLGLSRGAVNPVRILLRLLPPGQPDSRFGMDAEEVAACLLLCREHCHRTQLLGFSFHLSGYDIGERAGMLDYALGWVHRARGYSLPVSVVNAGGGWPVSYVDPMHWQAFLTADSADQWYGRQQYRDFYPYGNGSNGGLALSQFLEWQTVPGEGGVAQKLGDAGVSLWLEPGRALLDQAGVTLFQVQGVKSRPAANIVTVNGNSFSLSEQWFATEYLPDPVLLGEHLDAEMASAPYMIAGNTCLDADRLSRRLRRFPRALVQGDVLVYANTAGYQMDSNESPFHALPLPPKVAVSLVGSGVSLSAEQSYGIAYP